MSALKSESRPSPVLPAILLAAVLVGIMTALLTVLRLTGIVDWNWLSVLSPLWVWWVTSTVGAVLLFIFSRTKD